MRSGPGGTPLIDGCCAWFECSHEAHYPGGDHLIFLEPEGLTTHEIYPNGISTSLPFDIQLALVRSMNRITSYNVCYTKLLRWRFPRVA